MANFCNNSLCAWALINNKRPVEKFLYSYPKFNNEYFWKRVSDVKKHSPIYKPSKQLIYETSINLNNTNESRTVLYIGLNPEDKFQVYARLEKKSASDCYMFTLSDFQSLLNNLSAQKTEIFDDIKPVKRTCFGRHFEFFPINEGKNSVEIVVF